jgi:hypothetical protein
VQHAEDAMQAPSQHVSPGPHSLLEAQARHWPARQICPARQSVSPQHSPARQPPPQQTPAPPSVRAHDEAVPEQAEQLLPTHALPPQSAAVQHWPVTHALLQHTRLAPHCDDAVQVAQEPLTQSPEGQSELPQQAAVVQTPAQHLAPAPQSAFCVHAPQTPLLHTWPVPQSAELQQLPGRQVPLQQLCPAEHCESSVQATHCPLTHEPPGQSLF